MSPEKPDQPEHHRAADPPRAADHPAPQEKVFKSLIDEEMKQSYLSYSMSVIVGRALPDSRDGLKPVHRRVLYTMYENGLFHNKPFRKSANVVGNCMANYHPHGDSAIYDTIVRMAQDFSLRYPLVQGHGNFGSIDGDAPAAMRYTEARLSKIAGEMLADIDKETVPFQPNFDGSAEEPLLLPSRIPNLLINGSSGIAVGMATNIPPHNLGEIADGIIRVIEQPDTTVAELLSIIKGPDFPTGGIICGRSGLVEAYTTGRGKILVRATTEVVESAAKKSIIVTEIPYMVNKADLITQIADCVREKRITGISDIRDESDRDGIRIVIELKREANSDVVLNQLYKHSRLQDTFGIITIALVNNQPRTLNLKQLIICHINHRREVIRKRTAYDLRKAQEREHIIQGLMVALAEIDAVVELIKKSQTVQDARDALMANFSLSEPQATAVLDMKLQKLSSLEQRKLKEELDELGRLIAELTAILASEERILGLIKDELRELKRDYGDARRTSFMDGEEDIEIEDLIKEETIVVTITRDGYIKRLPLDTYRQQKRGGKGIIATRTKEEDVVEDLFITSTHATLLLFTNQGTVHWLKAYQVPEESRISRGKAIVNLLNLQDEKVTTVIPIAAFSEGLYLLLATRKGIVKKTELMAYARPRSTGIRGIILDEGDELINAVLTDGTRNIIMATTSGNAVKFSEDNVRAMGRTSRGVIGIRLRDNDAVVSMSIADDRHALLTVTENGYGKRSMIADYRLINRGGFGVINIQCTERNGAVVAAMPVQSGDEVILISRNGIIIRMPVDGISLIGRNTQGVRLMKLEEGDQVVSAAKVATDTL